MKVVLATDERTELVDVILEDLAGRGHEVLYFGPGPGEESVDWPDITFEAVMKVNKKEADQAIVMCWTGTGCSIAANKVPGIRAALCGDAETAKGARIWNHANVLALSNRATSAPVVKEILNSWFATPISDDAWNLKQMARLKEIEDGERGD